MAISDFVSMWEAGGQAGRDARTRRTLADYAQPALGGDKDALGKIYAVDPDAGYKVQGMARQQREQDYGDLVRAAQFYAQTGDKNAYGVLREQATRLGPQFAGLPASIDTPEDAEGSRKFAEAIAQSFGGGQSGSAVQSTYVNRDGYRVAIMRDGSEKVLGQAEARTQVYNSADGAQMLDMRKGEYRPFVPQGAQQGEYTPQQAAQFPVVESSGMPVRIEPGIDPAVVAHMQQNPDAWATGQPQQLPPRVTQPPPQPLRPYQAPPSQAEQTRLGFEAQRLELDRQREQRAQQAAQSQAAERERKARQPAAPKPLTSEAATKAALLDNATRAANNWYAMVVNPDGSYNDMAANSPAARSLLNQALRAKLRAESGATITEEEIAGEFNRYFGGLSSAITSDETMAQRAKALLDDLATQRGAFGAGAPQPQPRPAQAPQRQQPAPPPRRPVLPSQAAQPESDDDLVNKYLSP